MHDLDLDAGPVWDRFFLVAPLVIIGTTEPDGASDLAPKHLAMPMGWDGYFGFVCTPRHATYRNALRTEEFTVSYPRPEQVVFTSMAATPRDESQKPSLRALPTEPATDVKGVLLSDAYVHLECRLDRVVEGFGENGLVVGTVVAARVHPDALRDLEQDDQELVAGAPLLAYLPPGRYGIIERSATFPFHAGFER